MTNVERLSAAVADRYLIERELGSGGMATVYLAEDLKHARKVAIKVLRPELAAVIGADRFLSEIKTTANLQHPHILPLHDSGAADGFLFYVMPFVEGESLRDRLDREKQLPIADAIRISAEVASALDYAHRHNVIHRDIKPENILLHDGRALVADFGIALAASKAGSTRMTETGMSLGTPHYMSPEQAMGEREITGRSDVYALGCVTYEMLCGEPPFAGPTAQAIVAKVLTEVPRPLLPKRHTIPPYVERAVLTALEKLPADRFATPAEFATALVTPIATTGPIRSALPMPRRDRIVGAAVVALAFGAIGWMAATWWSGRNTTQPVVVRYNIDIAATILPTSVAIGTNIAVAPDGRAIAYIQMLTSGITRVYYRRLEDAVAQPIPGTEGAQTPAFSPDGKWIAYLVGNAIWKVQVTGGAPVPVGPTDATPVGMAWAASGQIFTGTRRGLIAVSASGGPPEVLAEPDTAAGELYFNQPTALPDGETVLFSIQFIGGLTRSRLASYSITKKKVTRFDLAGFDPLAYIDRTLIYVTAAGALTAIPFDMSTGRVTGNPVALGPTIVTTVAGASEAVLSASGTLLYQPVTAETRLGWVDLRGTFTPLLNEPQAYAYPRLSPDGRQIVMSIGTGGRGDVWIYDLASGTPTRLTSTGTYNDRPEWSADGRAVFFRSDRGQRTAIWQQAADLSTSATTFQVSDRHDFYEGVPTPDGRYFVYQVDDAGIQQADVLYRAMSGDTTSKPVAANTSVEAQPRVSPDGHWVAYVTDASGVSQVLVRPFPGPGGQVQVSVAGGSEPVWSRDGRRLYYRDGRSMTAVSFTTTPTFAVTRRDELFRDEFVFAQAPHANYDVAPGGTRFLMVQGTEGTKLSVVFGFQHELHARMHAAAGQ